MTAKNPWAATIEAAIDATGMTIPQFAKRHAIPASLLYNWTSPDAHGPGKTNLKKLAKALGVEPSSLQQQAPKKATAIRESTPAPYTHDPIRTLHASAAQQQSAWLWEYTLQVMEAMTARYRLEGPSDLAADGWVPTGPVTTLTPPSADQRKRGAG